MGEDPKDHWAQLRHVELDCQITNWLPQEERRSQEDSRQSFAEDFEGHRAPSKKSESREGGNRRHDHKGSGCESMLSHITEHVPQEQYLVLQVEGGDITTRFGWAGDHMSIKKDDRNVSQHAIIDNSKEVMYLNAAARLHAARRKVRGAYQKRGQI